ncbi:MAG: hypothetical protein ACJ759_23025 [Thermoanaerobaculia bacterium]
MQGYVPRKIQGQIEARLADFPVVAVLGPRQCGKLDLVLERGRRRIAVECKASMAPTVSRGFWSALEDLGIDEAWVVAPVAEPYPLRKGVTVVPLRALLDHLAAA